VKEKTLAARRLEVGYEAAVDEAAVGNRAMIKFLIRDVLADLVRQAFGARTYERAIILSDIDRFADHSYHLGTPFIELV
jgi:hypothetical protein